MKRTANKFQRAYMVAKARVQEVESQQEAIEKKFIADKGIVNPDGSVPEFLYCMEDDAAFEKANDECAALIVSAGLEEELNAARPNKERGICMNKIRRKALQETPIIIPRRVKNKISAIYEHPNEIYSVYMKETGEAVWIDRKIDLYRFLSSLSGKL